MLTALLLMLLAAPAHASALPSPPTVASAFTLSGPSQGLRVERLQRLSRGPVPAPLLQSSESPAEPSTQERVGRILRITGASIGGGYIGLITLASLAGAGAGDGTGAGILLVGIVGSFIVMPVAVGLFVAGTIIRNRAQRHQVALLPMPVREGAGGQLSLRF